MNISAIVKSDCGKLAELHATAFPKGWSAAELARLSGERGVIALTSGAPDPVGFILVRMVSDEAEVLTLATHPAHRRSGVGQALLTQSLIACEQSGIKRVLLEVSRDNDAAIQLYFSHGFRESGLRKAYYADGSDAIVMEKTLGE